MVKIIPSRLHHRPNNRIIIALIIIAVIISSIIGVFVYTKIIHFNKDLVVTKYINALKNKDLTSALDLVAPEYDAGQEMSKDIKELGGKDLKVVSKVYEGSENSSVYNTVRISGFKGAKPFERILNLSGQENAWYVIMGHIKPEYVMPTNSEGKATEPTAEEKKMIESCGIDTCCIASARILVFDKSKTLIDNGKSCPLNMKKTNLGCKNSLNWCEISQ